MPPRPQAATPPGPEPSPPPTPGAWVIWKFAVPLAETGFVTEIVHPRGAVLIGVANQHEQLAVWFRTRLRPGGGHEPLTRRTLYIVCTGEPVSDGHPAGACPLLGTVAFDGGQFILHVFDGGEAIK